MTTLDPLPHLYATYSDEMDPEDHENIREYSHSNGLEVEEGKRESYESDSPHAGPTLSGSVSAFLEALAPMLHFYSTRALSTSCCRLHGHFSSALNVFLFLPVLLVSKAQILFLKVLNIWVLRLLGTQYHQMVHGRQNANPGLLMP